MRALYKYPQAAFPYTQLVGGKCAAFPGRARVEISDTGVFDENRYFDVFAEYAKAAPEDLCIRITIANRGPEEAAIHVLPTLWFRNTWTWTSTSVDKPSTLPPLPRPELTRLDKTTLAATHATLGTFRFDAEGARELLFTENNTNNERLFGAQNTSAFVKDAFHDFVIHGERDSVNPEGRGTKAAAHYTLKIPAGERAVIRLRLRAESDRMFGPWADFDKVFGQRIAEADVFYASRLPENLTPDQRLVVRQAYAGLLWSKQWYDYVVKTWMEGDAAMPVPPKGHASSRNSDWPHLFNSDVISMPDKWEYPWYAAWDLAFHMIPFARLDRDFAKEQLQLFLREWYMHPNGQIPAYEWNFSDVNPPVHAWACWRIYKISAPQGKRDTLFLERCFQKLLLNFTWWVNRKDAKGKHLFGGGFLGLDNIGLFDRSNPLPDGRQLAAGGWHGVDGFLLRHDARNVARTGAHASRPTKTSRRSSSSTSSTSSTP